MNRIIIVTSIFTVILWNCLQLSMAEEHPTAGETPITRSIASGLWSDATTWLDGHVPTTGDRVLVRSQDRVVYDVECDDIIRCICISGELTFARDRDTLLNVGLIRIEAGDEYSEGGFDCEHVPDSDHVHEHNHGDVSSSQVATLEVGTANDPIPAKHKATIRLHHVSGMNVETCPAIICCGGRMDIHGAPLRRTWVKLASTADTTATRITVADDVSDWRVGDQLLVTGSSRQDFGDGTAAVHVTEKPASEVRTIKALESLQGVNQMAAGATQRLELNEPLNRTHLGGKEFSAEVANLSRNVVIESANPDGVRGHTMYHADSIGSISYAEFRHLGKRGGLGKYPIHYHLVGDTMRGSSVIGVSIWDSQNRWLTIHGTQYLVVRDCIGFQSVGHGFFLEDGTETYNILDGNLAVAATVGLPLRKQVLPFDRNDGAGFWWANSLNAFTNNVAVDCDQHGFRFEAEKSEQFDPILPILQPDGTHKPTDIRTLPFLCFNNNEAHCQRRFGLNLGGIRGMTFEELLHSNDKNAKQDISHSITGTVDGIGPDAQHPFIIRNFKVWDTHWAFHAGSPSVTIDGLNVFDCNYGMWRSVIDLHHYDNLSFREIHAHSIFFPMGGHGPKIHLEDGSPSYPATDAVDDYPPVCIVTNCQLREDGTIFLRGTVVDNEVVERVVIGDSVVSIGKSGVSDWSTTCPGSTEPSDAIAVAAYDTAGNCERQMFSTKNAE